MVSLHVSSLSVKPAAIHHYYTAIIRRLSTKQTISDEQNNSFIGLYKNGAVFLQNLYHTKIRRKKCASFRKIYKLYINFYPLVLDGNADEWYNNVRYPRPYIGCGRNPRGGAYKWQRSTKPMKLC